MKKPIWETSTDATPFRICYTNLCISNLQKSEHSIFHIKLIQTEKQNNYSQNIWN